MSEEITETKTEEKGLKAKTVSLIGKIAGALIIVGGAVLKWTNVLPGAEIDDIVKIGFCTMGIFSAIDINIMIDKFTGKK